MAPYNCERNWALRIPTGEEDSTCFGMDRSMYVPFWCVVAVLTLIVCAIQRIRQHLSSPAKRSDDDIFVKIWERLRRRGSGGNTSKLEAPLLAVQAEEPCLVSSEKMNQVCQERGVAHGLEAASLAVFLAMQRRSRYRNATCGFIPSGAKGSQTFHAIEVDLEPPQTSFAAYLAEVDKSLDALQPPSVAASPDAEQPETFFSWGQKPRSFKHLPGQWSVWKTEDDQIMVNGTSPQEENSFRQLFNACAAEPDGNLWQFPMLTQSVAEQLRRWGAPPMDGAQYKDAKHNRMLPVTSLISDVNPDADAVAGDGFKISYAELQQRAEIVARTVEREADKEADKTVAIFMGRCEAIAPAFLGVLKSGFCVVPLDIHWPADRIKIVASDAKIALALTATAWELTWMSLNLSVTTKVLDSEFFACQLQTPNPQAAESPRAQPDQDDPALILFTSGSTGKPKGIVLSHRYVTVLTTCIADNKRYHPGARALGYHSPTWMPFLDYLFAPLIKGGCSLQVPEGATHVVDPLLLKDFANRHQATHCGFVPATLQIMLESGLPSTIKDLGVGGAAVSGDISHQVVAALPADGQHYVGYSGTEQGDVCLIKMRSASDVNKFTAKNGLMGGGVPHGVQRCTILDEGFQLAGPGCVGEVSATGPGLASGYLNMPDLTEKTFLKGLPVVDGETMMRTGDLAKWSDAGNLQLVGRLGSMVKVRGARVELGEVESVVNSHPDVTAAVVTVYEDKLLAYVVPAVPGNLRDFCKERMVAYMVPHMFEELEEVPRLANGKVNKKALPTPKERDGAETVMELDSLGQMRKFTRRAVSEDKILDNVRALLLAVVIQSHATPLLPGSAAMLDVASRPLNANWGPIQLFLLQITRGGGWSSLAFLNGFDDTRGEEPFGFTYREGLFLSFWFISDFEWDMWYLPAFVLMRAMFIAAHKIGPKVGILHMLVVGQIWLVLPAFVDFYVGWTPNAAGIPLECPKQCFCLWQEWPQAQTYAYYLFGWWVARSDPVHHSYLGNGLIFYPCYWIGFYTGGRIFSWLAKVADEPSRMRRFAMAGGMLIIYFAMYISSRSAFQSFDDRCSAFWSENGFAWDRVVKNITYYALNLLLSLTYVVMIAATVKFHFKYLAKICFFALLLTSYTPCLTDFAVQVLELRKILPASISPFVETLWVFTVPMLYEFVGGSLVVSFMGVIIPMGRRAVSTVLRNIREAKA